MRLGRTRQLGGRTFKREVALLRIERGQGRFPRSFRSDTADDGKRVATEIKHGALRVTVPKAKPRATRRLVKLTRSS